MKTLRRLRGFVTRARRATYLGVGNSFKLVIIGGRGRRFSGTTLVFGRRGSQISTTLSDAIDFKIIKEVFLHERYRAPYAGKTVLDLGAHKGFFFAYAFLEGAKRIIAYEPEERNFNASKELARQLPAGCLSLRKKAIASHDGFVELAVDSKSWSHTICAEKLNSRTTRTVEACFLESAIQEAVTSDKHIDGIIVKDGYRRGRRRINYGHTDLRVEVCRRADIRVPHLLGVSFEQIEERLCECSMTLREERGGGVYYFERSRE